MHCYGSVFHSFYTVHQRVCYIYTDCMYCARVPDYTICVKGLIPVRLALIPPHMYYMYYYLQLAKVCACTCIGMFLMLLAVIFAVKMYYHHVYRYVLCA